MPQRADPIAAPTPFRLVALKPRRPVRYQVVPRPLLRLSREAASFSSIKPAHSTNQPSLALLPPCPLPLVLSPVFFHSAGLGCLFVPCQLVAAATGLRSQTSVLRLSSRPVVLWSNPFPLSHLGEATFLLFSPSHVALGDASCASSWPFFFFVLHRFTAPPSSRNTVAPLSLSDP
jgi:hypothetical protein